MTSASADHNRLHARARKRGVNPIVYWLTRAFFQPFAHLYRLAQGVSGDEICSALGQTAEAVDSVPLLAARVRDAGVDAPVLGSLAGLIEGRVEPARFTSSLTAPKKKAKARAA